GRNERRGVRSDERRSSWESGDLECHGWSAVRARRARPAPRAAAIRSGEDVVGMVRPPVHRGRSTGPTALAKSSNTSSLSWSAWYRTRLPSGANSKEVTPPPATKGPPSSTEPEFPEIEVRYSVRPAR